MMLSSLIAGVKLLGLTASFVARGESPSKDFREEVAVSILLDEWCRTTGVKRNNPEVQARLSRIQSLRAAGVSLEAIRLDINT